MAPYLKALCLDGPTGGTMHFIPAAGAFEQLFRGAQATQRLVAGEKLPVFAAKVIALVISGAVTEVVQLEGGGEEGQVKMLQQSASFQENLRLFINASGLPGTSSPDAGTAASPDASPCGLTHLPWTPESFAVAAKVSYKSLNGYHHNNNTRVALRKEAKLLQDLIDDYTRDDKPFESFLVEHYTAFEAYVLDKL